MKEFLAVALLAGNKLNAGTVRGNAQGFKPSSYMKLLDTKSNKGNLTLLSYIIRTLIQSQPESLEFSEKFETLKEASKYSLEELKKEA
jgi:hypothetical protein